MTTFISVAPVLYSNAFDHFSRVSDSFTKKEKCKALVCTDAQSGAHITRHSTVNRFQWHWR